MLNSIFTLRSVSLRYAEERGSPRRGQVSVKASHFGDMAAPRIMLVCFLLIVDAAFEYDRKRIIQSVTNASLIAYKIILRPLQFL